MTDLDKLVYIANNAKTDAQKNAVGEELKKFLRGLDACKPNQVMFSNMGFKIEQGKKLRVLGQGVYGTVFYGCLENECKTKIAVKITNDPTAEMEYRIAEKLRGMGVPRMYHFKSCGKGTDVLYFEYVKGEPLSKWIRKKHSTKDYRQLISRLIGNLKKIHEKYTTFRHHDLHWNNLMVKEGNIPVMIDFGMATIRGVKNPVVSKGEFKSDGIYSGSHYMYDAHYILNIIYHYTQNDAVQKFLEDVFPKKYLTGYSNVVTAKRLRPVKHEDLPTYDDILKHPFFKASSTILRKKVAAVPKPQQKVGTVSAIRRAKAVLQKVPRVAIRAKVKTPAVVASQRVGTVSAIRRAKAVLQKEAEKKKVPLKRPGVAKRVTNQVREIEKKIADMSTRPKVFINKNGDLKIGGRKCRLYKKEDLIKTFKLKPSLTKEQMCKAIKNM